MIFVTGAGNYRINLINTRICLPVVTACNASVFISVNNSSASGHSTVNRYTALLAVEQKRRVVHLNSAEVIACLIYNNRSRYRLGNSIFIVVASRTGEHDCYSIRTGVNAFRND